MSPEQIATAFDKIYNIIASDGREALFFGAPNKAQIAQAVALGSQVFNYPSFYLEFPLAGAPWLDILISHGNGRFLPYTADTAKRWHKMPFGAAFKWAIDYMQDKDFAFGTEFDLSLQKDGLPTPGFYIDNADNDGLLRGVMSALNESSRTQALLGYLAQTPPGWTRYYLGFMPGRPDSPLRLGFMIDTERIKEYQENLMLLAADLQVLGFSAFDTAMLKEITNPVFGSFSWELQLDLYPDGTIGPVLGLIYSFHNGGNNESIRQLDTDRIQLLMQHLKEQRLIDDRWHRLPECLFYKKHLYITEEWQMAFCGISCSLNVLKIKWKNKNPQPAKFYLHTAIFDLNLKKPFEDCFGKD